MQPNQPNQIPPQPSQPTGYPPQPNPAAGSVNGAYSPGYSQQNQVTQPVQSTQPGYPSQNYGHPAPQGQPTPSAQPPAAPQQPAYSPQYQPQSTHPQTQSPLNQPQSQPLAATASQRPSQQAASWYQPTKKEPDNKPSSVDEYLKSAKPSQPPIPTGQNVPGQVINGQYAVDYLGGIAPAQSNDEITIAGKSISKNIFYIGIGLIGALILAVMFMLFTPKKEGISTLNESSLYSSMVATSEITKKAGKNIKNSKLRAINSSLNSQLIGSIQEMNDPLTKSGIDPKPLETAAKKPDEAESEKLQMLEDARLNATYDRAYSREMIRRLETMLITLDRIEKINQRESMQTFVKNTKPKLESLKKSIEDLAI